MGRRNEEYIDFTKSYSPGGRNQKNNGVMVIGIIIVAIIALALGAVAYRISKNNLPKDPDPEELSRFTETEKAQPSSTPTPTATLTPVLNPTDTPIPTPTPFVDPGFDDPYLVGFVDFRTKSVDDIKGIYTGHLKSSNEEFIEKILWLAGSTELNSVVIDIKDDNGYITYAMDCPFVQEAGSVVTEASWYSLGDIKETLDRFHEAGIYCIARVVGFRDAQPEKSSLKDTHPDWLITTKAKGIDGTYLNADSGNIYVDGDGYTWMNPYNRDACRYVADIAVQAAKDGFDEILFDYVRFPDKYLDSIFYGGEKEQVSVTAQIERFVRYACNRIKPLGTYVSIATFGSIITSSIDEDTVGQKYAEIAKYADYICPMIYPSLYKSGDFGYPSPNKVPAEIVNEAMKASERKLRALKADTGYAATCRPWLQAYNFGGQTYDYGIIRREIDACFDNGVYNWTLWNQSAYYEQEYFLTLEEEIEKNKTKKY